MLVEALGRERQERTSHQKANSAVEEKNKVSKFPGQ